MKLAAIICEFDPLHTGHKRLIDFAKSKADSVVCVMSGNFTQRGMPACADKYSRARHAIYAGADMVVELPTIFATSSAENFAFGGVKTAVRLGADCLAFGSECGSVEKLYNCLDVVDDPEVQAEIKRQMSAGVSYPKAVANAAKTDILDKPNNTLAVEYLRAIRRLGSEITPLTLCREDNFNNAKPMQYASSAALRQDPALRAEYTFDFVRKDICDNIVNRYKQVAPSFISVATRNQLSEIEGITEGLENKIANAAATDFETLFEQIKSKRYTRLRLQRIVLNLILGITKNLVQESKNSFPPVKALAVKKESAALLAQTDDETDELTARADKFFDSLAQIQTKRKLLIL